MQIGKPRKKISVCIFSEKLILEKGIVVNYEFMIPIEVIHSVGKVLKNLNKKEVKNDPLSCLDPMIDGGCKLFVKECCQLSPF